MAESSEAKLRYMARYQRRKENVDKRVARNRARRKAIREGRARVGDGTEVDHKQPLDKGGSTSDSNTRVVSEKFNRGWRKRTPGMYGKND